MEMGCSCVKSGMGIFRSKEDNLYVSRIGEVDFDHFSSIRAIGKGSFGKVCIVRKKNNLKEYAMKYMNKNACRERDALKNVIREAEILTKLDHPFLVNIWYAFQDEEDLCMVVDLLIGGDLRYHIKHQREFSEDAVKLMVCEMGLALDYLQSKHILHRDVKPDNILLDEAGHFHLTDFNVATVLDHETHPEAASVCGTKPYIAPEIFDVALYMRDGYSYPVDWWSLGVVAYEISRGCLPFDIHSYTSMEDIRAMFRFDVVYPEYFTPGFTDMISKLLCIDPKTRISSIEALKRVKCLRKFDMDLVYKKKYVPFFTPREGYMNYDPAFELEEMIVETKPLHKKNKRLKKQRSLREMQKLPSSNPDGINSTTSAEDVTFIPEFRYFDRYQEQEKRKKERKKRDEQDWMQDLLRAMDISEPVVQTPKLPNCVNSIRTVESIEEEEDDVLEDEGDKSQLHLPNNNRDGVTNKQQNIDFIDRTPSPTGRTKDT